MLLGWIPVIGWIIVPFIVGFYGNAWVWKKHMYKSSTAFSKAQFRWVIMGIIAWILGSILICIYTMKVFELTKNMNHVKSIIEISNHNDFLVNYFGSPIVFTHGELIYKLKPNLVENIVAEFNVQGSKNKGMVRMHLIKKEHIWIMLDLKVCDEDDNNGQTVISSYASTATNFWKLPYISNIQGILDSISSYGRNKYFFYYRSRELRDYMLVYANLNEAKESCFTIKYSDNLLRKSRKQYFSYNACVTKKEASEILFDYASGRDDFKQNPHWYPIAGLW
jgi:hypothetical protein